MSQAPSMPMFADAFIAATTHLTLEQRGAYALILLTTWNRNAKPLPDDAKLLARILGITRRRWENRIRPALVEFFDLSGRTWRQKRLEREWDYVASRLHRRRGPESEDEGGGGPDDGGHDDGHADGGQNDHGHGDSLAADSRSNRGRIWPPNDHKSDDTRARPNPKPNPINLSESGDSESDGQTAAIGRMANGHRVDNGQMRTAIGHRSRRSSRYPPDVQKALCNPSRMIEFAEFWACYPHKVKRLRAIAAFDRARQTATLAEIITGAQRYATALRRPNPPSPANPDTWLFNERWNDQPLETAAEIHDGQRDRENGAGRSSYDSALAAGAELLRRTEGAGVH